MKNGKVWGTTELLLVSPFVTIHRLSILPHSRCSLHLHKNRCNAFYVLSGKLFIEVHQQEYDLVDRTELRATQLTTVPNGLKHMFSTENEPAECLEIYYPPTLNVEDIVRDNTGMRTGT